MISQRTGKPRWGKGQIANGRPLDYDGRRIVFAAGRKVYAVAAEKPAPGAALRQASPERDVQIGLTHGTLHNTVYPRVLVRVSAVNPAAYRKTGQLTLRYTGTAQTQW